MDLARVEGTVVSTAKTDRLHGHKLLVVNLLRPDKSPSGTELVAVDSVGAGEGEIVLIVRGSSARQTDEMMSVPTDATIVAIVDSIVYRGEVTYDKQTENG
ncbi:MAG: EutN/CcmL family microcompartment protein [Acidobacteriota bacterium]|nr:MAG: EutN/CcmL family microcompartment protein [Acidobacteriota bacterium]